MSLEVEVEIDGVKKVVKLKRIEYGEYTKILQSVLKVEMIGETPKSQFDIIKFRHDVTKTCIENTDIDLDKLPVNVALLIEDKVFEYNELMTRGSFFQRGQ